MLRIKFRYKVFVNDVAPIVEYINEDTDNFYVSWLSPVKTSFMKGDVRIIHKDGKREYSALSEDGRVEHSLVEGDKIEYWYDTSRDEWKEEECYDTSMEEFNNCHTFAPDNEFELLQVEEVDRFGI